MSTQNFTWGILTSSVISILFHRHMATDTNGEPHHIISCSDPVYLDSANPSLFSLCAATLLGIQDPHALDTEPVSAEITLQPYTFPLAARPSNATRSKFKAWTELKSRFAKQSSSATNPAGSTPVPLQTLHSCTQLGVQKVATLEYRVGVHGQCLWKVFLIPFYFISYHIVVDTFHSRQCTTLHVQFVESYWPNLIHNVRRVHSDTSLFSRHTVQGTICHFFPPHLKLYERLGGGECGEVLNGIVSVPQSRVKHNVVAKLFHHANLDKLHNEIHLYRTRLVGLHNRAVPKVFGAFMVRGSRTAAETTKWGIILMEKCGSVAESVDQLTVDQRQVYVSFTHSNA